MLIVGYCKPTGNVSREANVSVSSVSGSNALVGEYLRPSGSPGLLTRAARYVKVLYVGEAGPMGSVTYLVAGTLTRASCGGGLVKFRS